MELEPAHSEFADQPLGLLDRPGPGQRIDRSERDQHVVVPRGALRDLLAAVGRVAQVGAGVDREHDRRKIQCPVVVGDLVQRRPLGEALK